MSGIENWPKRWNEEPKRETIAEKVREFISPPPPLKRQIMMASYRVASQMNKLEYTLSKLQAYDKQLFEKVVNAIIEGDKNRAAMYANEVAEVRRMAKIIMTVKYALEKVKLRLDTTLIMGDVNADLAPAIVALKQVAVYLRGTMPDVFADLMDIDEQLSAALTQYTSGAVPLFENEYVTEEAQKILKEASIVAEQRMKQEFPELPSVETAVPSSQQTGTATAASTK
ncbi:MAG: Snf7 family protein [Acidilobus sp.]